MTCYTQKDPLFHILFVSDNDFIIRLIEESIISISREYSSNAVREALVDLRPKESDSLNKLRAKFFILLNQDTHMHKRLINPTEKSCVLCPVDRYKANVFFEDLNMNVIPAYAQDHTVTLEQFVDNIRDSYLCS